MAIPALALAIPAILGAAKAGFGMYQKNKGAKILENTSAPIYKTPEEVQSNLTTAQKMALEGMPAEQKNQYLQSVDRSTATALSASASRKGGLSIVDDILKRNTDAYSNLLSQDASQKLSNQQLLMAQRQNVANYADKEFDLNQMQIHRQRLAAGQALVGSGIQNMFGGAQDVGGAAMNYFNSRPQGQSSFRSQVGSDNYTNSDNEMFVNQMNQMERYNQANGVQGNPLYNQSQFRLE